MCNLYEIAPQSSSAKKKKKKKIEKNPIFL